MKFRPYRSSNVKKECDLLFSKIVRNRGVCDKCGNTTGLQCAHIISRNFSATRHDLDNALCLCSGCHMFWHHEPIEATRWFENKYPGRYDKLNFKRHAVTKMDYMLVKLYLKQLESPAKTREIGVIG